MNFGKKKKIPKHPKTTNAQPSSPKKKLKQKQTMIIHKCMPFFHNFAMRLYTDLKWMLCFIYKILTGAQVAINLKTRPRLLIIIIIIIIIMEIVQETKISPYCRICTNQNFFSKKRYVKSSGTLRYKIPNPGQKVRQS